jgi:AcrR family transcriptional regulator
LTLLEQKDVALISVQEIAEQAEVNRSTFYLHFQDKDDLVKQTLDMLFDDLVKEERSFVDAHHPVFFATPPDPLVNLFKRIGERPRLYRNLLGDYGDSSFIRRLDRFHEDQFLRHWNALNMVVGDGESPPAFRSRFAAEAIHGAISWWLEHRQDERAETVVGWLWQGVRVACYPHADEGNARESRIPGVSDGVSR